MNIFQQLENNHSKENSIKILDFIGKDEKRFEELMHCFFKETKDYRVPQRAAHVVSMSFDKNPELIMPYINQLIEHLYKTDLRSPLKRNILRILQFCEIPDEERGGVYDRVFGLLINPAEDIAVRAFAATVLYNITEYYPELKPELKSAVEFVLEEPGCSPGVRSRGKKVWTNLQKDLSEIEKISEKN